MRTIPTLLLTASLAMPLGAVADEPMTDDKYEQLFYQMARQALNAGQDPIIMLSHARSESLFAAAMARAAAEYDNYEEIPVLEQGNEIKTAEQTR